VPVVVGVGVGVTGAEVVGAGEDGATDPAGLCDAELLGWADGLPVGAGCRA
jgi:hypothetical protein